MTLQVWSSSYPIESLWPVCGDLPSNVPSKTNENDARGEKRFEIGSTAQNWLAIFSR
jgi:hypothetical protein